jgi:four helix bundle protein
MFLQLAHTKLKVFQQSHLLSLECYKVTKQFPPEERFALTQQIRRAAIYVHLNLAEGCSGKSDGEQKRYFEIARGSVIEVDTAIGIGYKLNYTSLEELEPLSCLIIETFKLLTGMIN